MKWFQAITSYWQSHLEVLSTAKLLSAAAPAMIPVMTVIPFSSTLQTTDNMLSLTEQRIIENPTSEISDMILDSRWAESQHSFALDNTTILSTEAIHPIPSEKRKPTFLAEPSENLQTVIPISGFFPRQVGTKNNSPQVHAEKRPNRSVASVRMTKQSASFTALKTTNQTQAAFIKNTAFVAPETIDIPTSPNAGHSPSAVSDSLATSLNTPLTLHLDKDLLANDTDPDGDTLNIASIDLMSTSTPPGTLVEDAGTWIYTPGLNVTGSDSFYYRVTDGQNVSQGLVSIDITAPVPPSLVQHVYGQAIDGLAVTTVNEVSATPDALYIAFVSHNDDLNTVATVSGLGLTWALLSQCAVTEELGMEAWWAYGTPSSASTVEALFPSVIDSANIAVVSYTGAAQDGLSATCESAKNQKAYTMDVLIDSYGAASVGVISNNKKDNTPVSSSFTQLLGISTKGKNTNTSLTLHHTTHPYPQTVQYNGEFLKAASWAGLVIEITSK